MSGAALNYKLTPTSEPMRADCPNCMGFAVDNDNKRRLVELYREGGDCIGLTHAIPGIWLFGRGRRIQDERGIDSIEAHFEACREFAWACSVENAKAVAK